MTPHSQDELQLGLNEPDSKAPEIPKLESPEKREAKPSATVRLSHEITQLQGLDPAEQLKQCEANLIALAPDLGGGSSKVLAGAMYLAFVAQHELWKLTEPEFGNVIEFGVALLRSKGVGSSTHNVRRLLKLGALGLELHANGLPLPTTAAQLQAILDAKLDDPMGGCRRLLGAHGGKFPDAAAIEAFFGSKQKTSTEDVGQQSPWRRVKEWTDEGVALVDKGGKPDQIRAVFAKIAELAKARCGAGKDKSAKRVAKAA